MTPAAAHNLAQAIRARRRMTPEQRAAEVAGIDAAHEAIVAKVSGPDSEYTINLKREGQE